MLIEKFKIFENIANADSFEDAKSLLESEGVDVSEGILSSMKNYFSRMLGGKVKKLDNVLKRYRQNEDKYWDNWIKARNKYYEASLMSGELNNPEREKYEELKERAEKYEKQVEDTRKEVNDALAKQAKILTGDNQRLMDYYEFNKAVADEQIAKETLEAAKRDLSDKQELDNIHARLAEATKKAGQAGKDFESKYSKDFDFNKFKEEDTDSIGNIDTDNLRAMSSSNLTELRKTLEGKLKRLRDNYDDKITDLKRDVEFKDRKDPDYEYHEKDLKKKTQEYYNRFSRERDTLKRQIESIDNLITSQKMGASNVPAAIKANPDMVNNVTKEEIGKVGVDDAVQTAITQTSQTTKPTQANVENLIDKNAEKFFTIRKPMIEKTIGEKLPDDVFNHLTNDLINLFGKVAIYYKSMKKDFFSQVVGVSIASFAKNIYEYKKKNNKLNKDLSDDEIEKKLKEYEDYENK